MTKLILLSLSLIPALLLTGCFAPDAGPADPQGEAGAPAVACPVVACGWTPDFTCPEESNTLSYENNRVEMEDGSTCWLYVSACVVTQPEPIDPACVPESCRVNMFTTCVGQP